MADFLQMLLDKYTMSKDFEKLISYHNSSSASGPPASYVKRVNQSMTRIDPLLKTLQVRPSPPEGLVQAYLIHIGDRSDTNFKKILELKGVRKQDQGHLLELFTIHRDSPSNKQLLENSPLLTPLMNTSVLGSAGLPGITTSGVPTPAGLQGRFDAASLGEKLLSAARDASDRLGTPTTPGLPGAPGEKVTMNENLKNIGKFFRRDIGVRFGKRDITPTGDGSQMG